jgi:ribosome maturation factor RimP
VSCPYSQSPKGMCEIMSEFKGPKEVQEFVRQIADKHGYQLVNISAKGGNTFHIDVVLDKEGGITLDECAVFNREVIKWIDTEKMFARGYLIDVSSPGLDRELRSDSEFAWAVGKRVMIVTRDASGKIEEFNGKIVSAVENREVVLEEDDGTSVVINRKNITRARLKIKS